MKCSFVITHSFLLGPHFTVYILFFKREVELHFSHLDKNGGFNCLPPTRLN